LSASMPACSTGERRRSQFWSRRTLQCKYLSLTIFLAHRAVMSSGVVACSGSAKPKEEELMTYWQAAGSRPDFRGLLLKDWKVHFAQLQQTSSGYFE